MEDAVDKFLTGSTEIHRKMHRVLRDHAPRRDGEWELKNLCRELISVNPLHLDTTIHGAFWDTLLEALHNREDITGNYVICINGTEIYHRVTHENALTCIMTIVLSTTLAGRLISYRGLPQHILLAFLRKDGYRTLLMERPLKWCTDKINLFELRQTGLIGVDLYDDLLEGEYQDNFNDEYETPEPELNWKDDDEAMRVDAVPDLPPRELVNTYTLEFERTSVAEMLVLYNQLWNAAAAKKKECEQHFHTCHGSLCACANRICDMRVLMSLAYALVTQSIDAKTLVKPWFQQLLHEGWPILEAVSTVIDDYRAYLTNAAYANKFAAEVRPKMGLSEKMLSEVKERVQDASSTANCWMIVALECCPVPVLLEELEVHFLSVYQGAKLRTFLEHKDRGNYVAYIMPSDVSSFSVVSSLDATKREFGPSWPDLFSYCVVSSLSATYCVIKPVHLSCIRLLTTLLVDDTLAATLFPMVFRAAFKPLKARDAIYRQVAVYCLMCMMERHCVTRLRISKVPRPTVQRGNVFKLLPNLLTKMRHATESEYWDILMTFSRQAAGLSISKSGLEKVIQLHEEADVYDQIFAASLQLMLQQKNPNPITLNGSDKKNADCEGYLDQLYAFLLAQSRPADSVLDILKDIRELVAAQIGKATKTRKQTLVKRKLFTPIRQDRLERLDIESATQEKLKTLDNEACIDRPPSRPESAMLPSLQNTLTHGSVYGVQRNSEDDYTPLHQDILQLAKTLHAIQSTNNPNVTFDCKSLVHDICSGEDTFYTVCRDPPCTYEMSMLLPIGRSMIPTWNRTDNVIGHPANLPYERTETILDTICQLPQHWTVSERYAVTTMDYIDCLKNIQQT